MNNITIYIYIVKIFFISICTYYTFTKIINMKPFFNAKLFVICVLSILISVICGVFKYELGTLVSFLLLILCLSIIYWISIKSTLIYSIIFTIISLSINYIIFFIALTISFFPSIILSITNDYLNLALTIILHLIMLILLFKIRKLKNGFSFLVSTLKNEFFAVLILNISVTILFSSIALTNSNVQFTSQIAFAFILFSIIMFITIKKSFEIYYKQNLLIKELEETKKTLIEREDEIKKLETENLHFSKTSHSIAHKQKSLEFKLNELLLKNETSEEIDIKERINKISDTCLNQNTTTALSKTNITQIDDMFKFMQSECIKNKIDFELQINGNIYYIINNFIDKDHLEVLIADLIKNAIIAINHSKNINRSILVRLGIIDGAYCLYIYDSGIEFEIDTLMSLGIKPCSTHLNDGGSGMGFLNIFDTLKKYNASMIINELTTPSKDNYTKIIMIKFDNQNCYKIISHRSDELRKQILSADFIIE